MKQSSIFICATLMLSSVTAFAQVNAQGNASAQSQTSVSAGREGAAATNSSSGTAVAETGKTGARLASGTQLHATLSKPVDAGKSKPGDGVTATAAEDIKSNGQVVVPKGSKLMGHVTSARPRGKSSGSSSAGDTGSAAGSATAQAASQLGIIFDKAVLKDGREVPLGAAIQAIAVGELHEIDTSSAGHAAGSGRAAGGGIVGSATGGVGGTVHGATSTVGGVGGSVGSTLGGTAGVLERSPGAIGGLNAAGRLTSESRGVFGMKGLELNSATTGSADGSLITSTTRNVRLDRGTRMLLVTSGSATGATNAAATGAGGETGAAGATGTVTGAASSAGNVGKTGSAASAAGTASGAINATNATNKATEPRAEPTPPADRPD